MVHVGILIYMYVIHAVSASNLTTHLDSNLWMHSFGFLSIHGLYGLKCTNKNFRDYCEKLVIYELHSAAKNIVSPLQYRRMPIKDISDVDVYWQYLLSVRWTSPDLIAYIFLIECFWKIGDEHMDYQGMQQQFVLKLLENEHQFNLTEFEHKSDINGNERYHFLVNVIQDSVQNAVANKEYFVFKEIFVGLSKNDGLNVLHFENFIEKLKFYHLDGPYLPVTQRENQSPI